MNNQTTINDHVCHLFKYGVNPKQISVDYLHDPIELSFYFNLCTPPLYSDSVNLSRKILDINYHKIVNKIIQQYCKYRKINLIHTEMLSVDLLKNIRWSKFPYKIDYIKPIQVHFEFFIPTGIVTVELIDRHYSMTVNQDFINYYNNIMSGKKKCPKALLENKDISYLLHLRSNINQEI